MKCPNCHAQNENRAMYCSKCGTKLQVENSNDSKNLLIIVLVAIIVIGALTGLYMVLNSNNSSTSSENIQSSESNVVEVQKENPSEPATWHQVNTYSGVGGYSTGVNIKGSQMKIQFSAFPIKNYADNHMKVEVYKNGQFVDSSSVSWNGKSAVATRSNTIEVSGSGNYQIYVDGYELQYWNMEIYEWY
ncbi:zinc ribbon domain-containing protein [Methanobrevibacter sp. DSM 116169]|uniref:zinc ribbon domain-containing protein n=1 Tax=Methanobrevibacter sp. DSM 116169 TaxID=3242727 RepID=UPI0038FC0557